MGGTGARGGGTAWKATSASFLFGVLERALDVGEASEELLLDPLSPDDAEARDRLRSAWSLDDLRLLLLLELLFLLIRLLLLLLLLLLRLLRLSLV